MSRAIGIDIGGTGIKGAVIDRSTGELVSDRMKVATPVGGKPDDILEATATMVSQLTDSYGALPVGICFPAIISHGHTMSAANISDKWIGLAAEELFEKRLKTPIHFVNDADAAGHAEVTFGAAQGEHGVVILTTLGTGIGSALLYNGALVPNTEFGHLELDGHEAEHKASYAAKERDNLNWEQWAKRLQRYYSHLEFLFTPDLFIVGGGVSKNYEDFLPLLDLNTRIVPATLRNNAGIMGAAALAVEQHSTS